MDVYLIPAGGGQYELYCEPGDEHAPAVGEPQRGVARALIRRFRAVLSAAEQEHAQPRAATAPHGWMGRLRARAMRWIVEKIAEQRLLWRLRGEGDVQAFFPDDLPASEAESMVRAILKRDGDRHRRWLLVDAALFVLSGLLMPVPGPNLVAYYFAFRLVGHYLSIRGARHGQRDVRWRFSPSGALSELRRAITLDGAERDELVGIVAARLHLQHLSAFVERTILPAA